jgi:ATP-binding cassette subfamily C protein CydC
MLALLALASFDAVSPLPAVFPAFAAVQASTRRIVDLADLPSPVVDPAEGREAPDRGDLAATDIRFGYRAGEPDVLQHVSCTLAPGGRVAIIGASGSGKSTLADLLLKFRPLGGGSISLAGTPWTELPGEAVRRRVGRLAQHDHLFSGSVTENLLLARPDASPEEIREACRTAQVLAFVEAQPEGFETQVGTHGALLSGGEVQRLLLARALLASRPFLVLDEPTEGLDGATEARVLESLLQRQGDTAMLLLTHRATGLDRMHEIIVLDGGRIVRRGPPSAMADVLRQMTPLEWEGRGRACSGDPINGKWQCGRPAP